METISSVPAIERGVRLLDVLATNKDGFTFGELFSKMDVPRASLFRILNELKKHGYVYQEFSTNRYMLGFKILNLGSIILKKFDVRIKARPFLQRLVAETLESAELLILKEENLFVVDKVDSFYPMASSVPIGKIHPFLHTTAHGMVFLANMDDTYREERLSKEFEKLGSNISIDNEEFNKIKIDGYAFKVENFGFPSSRFSSPVFDSTGNVVAAIGVAVPPFRAKEEIGCKVREMASEFSRQLGYSNSK